METKQVVSGYAIVVLDRGFVYVGDATIDDKQVIITNARNIRRWGTTLGALALSGPIDKTVLDDAGTVRAPLHAWIHTLDTEASLWKA